jgi:hypothetical protein
VRGRDWTALSPPVDRRRQARIPPRAPRAGVMDASSKRQSLWPSSPKVSGEHQGSNNRDVEAPGETAGHSKSSKQRGRKAETTRNKITPTNNPHTRDGKCQRKIKSLDADSWVRSEDLISKVVSPAVGIGSCSRRHRVSKGLVTLLSLSVSHSLS